jgi:hypothetical protein
VLSNVELLSGRTDWVNTLIVACLPGAFVIGLLRTLLLRRTHPERYANLTQTSVY